MAIRKARFEADLIQGHKGVVVVLVPFDPEDRWAWKPVRLAGRRHGWPVSGHVNDVSFTGYIGERWGRFFVDLDDAVRDAAGIAVGDTVSVTLAPTTAPDAFARAVEQSTRTTQPSKARPDAIEPSTRPARPGARPPTGK